jgi:hypothetical protein
MIGFEVGDGCIEDDARVLIGEGVEDPSATPLGLHDAVRAQQSECVRHGRIARAGPPREIGNAGLGMGAELQQDTQSRRVGEHVEQLGHNDDVLVWGDLGAVTMLRCLGPRHASTILEQLFR